MDFCIGSRDKAYAKLRPQFRYSNAPPSRPVNERVNELRNNNILDMTWTAPAVLTDNRIRAESDGQIFNTITNGIRAMPSYGSQIPVEDRWAIVAYVRALQFSQQAPAAAPGVVPAGTNIADK